MSRPTLRTWIDPETGEQRYSPIEDVEEGPPAPAINWRAVALAAGRLLAKYETPCGCGSGSPITKAADPPPPYYEDYDYVCDACAAKLPPTRNVGDLELAPLVRAWIAAGGRLDETGPVVSSPPTACVCGHAEDWHESLTVRRACGQPTPCGCDEYRAAGGRLEDPK